MASYIRNQPVATDDLSVSAPILANNTNKADDSFGVDHFQFSDQTANNGFHKKVTLPGNIAAPAPAAGYGDMYGVTNGSSETWPYWKRDGLATVEPMMPVRVFGEFTTNPIALRPFGFGITSITSMGTGRFRVDFAVAFPDTNYTVLTAMQLGTPPLATLCVLAYGQKLTTSVEVQLWRADGQGFSTLLPTLSVSVLRNG